MTTDHDPLGRRRLALSPLLGHRDFPPLSSLVQVAFGAQSRRGRLQTQKADHYLIVRLGRNQETIMTSLPRAEVPLPFDEFGYAMLVADGGGEMASRLALSTLVHLALHFGKWNVRIDEDVAHEVMERAERFYRQVDGVVTETRRTQPASAGMQTTLTAIYSAGSDCFFAHVGHSRAYLFRDGKLLQMTCDHTLDGARGRPHSLTPAARDLQHILTDTIGGGQAASLKVDVEHFRLLDRDLVLLCTNGLTDVVQDERIEAALGGNVTPAEHCQALVDMALEAGGQDDVTALIARYRIPA
jgi:protein phosphatase